MRTPQQEARACALPNRRRVAEADETLLRPQPTQGQKTQHVSKRLFSLCFNKASRSVRPTLPTPQPPPLTLESTQQVLAELVLLPLLLPLRLLLLLLQLLLPPTAIASLSRGSGGALAVIAAAIAAAAAAVLALGDIGACVTACVELEAAALETAALDDFACSKLAAASKSSTCIVATCASYMLKSSACS